MSGTLTKTLVVESPYGNGRVTFSQDVEAKKGVSFEIDGKGAIYACAEYNIHDASGQVECDSFDTTNYHAELDDIWMDFCELTDNGYSDRLGGKEPLTTEHKIVGAQLDWDLDMGEGELPESRFFRVYAVFAPNPDELIREIQAIFPCPKQL